MCRGNNWNTNGFPRNSGVITIGNCAILCDSMVECKAFDWGNSYDSVRECYLFGHSAVVAEAATGSPPNAQCWKKVIYHYYIIYE